MSIGSVCTGYGGLDMAAAEALGGELIFAADNDEGAAAILAHRYPSVKNLGDITAVDWAEVEPVDVLTAGFPCQDVSAAGKRAGLRKGNRSGIWIEVARAIAALRPGLVIIENVRGLLTARGDEPTDEHLRQEAARDAAMRLEQWLDNELNIAYSKGDADRVRRIRVRAARVMGARKRAVARCAWHERRLVRAIGTVVGSLADLGYDARWTVVRADDAGACHRRERVFIVAADADGGGRRTEPGEDGRRGSGRLRSPGCRPRSAADACGAGLEVGAVEHHGPERQAAERGGGDAPADSYIEHLGPDRRTAHGDEAVDRAQHPEPTGGRGTTPANADSAAGGRHEPGSGPGPVQGTAEPKWAQEQPGRLHSGGGDESTLAWGAYEPAIRRWEAATGRHAPAPTEPGRTGQRLSPRFVEWMMGLPEGWVTDVPGLSRNAQLKALGNGVVPQQAVMALRLLLGRVPHLAPERAA